MHCVHGWGAFLARVIYAFMEYVGGDNNLNYRGPMKNLMKTTLLATAATLAFSASAHAGAVTIDGSSSVYPITEAVAEEFQNAKKGAVQVTVGISGTGGGFKRFCRGETDIAEASRPISQEEIIACKNKVEYIELPVAFDALTVAVNPKNKLDCITTAQLKKMWEPGAQGSVTKWSDVEATWPGENLTLYGAGSDSGTFDYFTEAVNGKAKASRGDYTASEDDNVVVTGITGDTGALGYIPYAYYAANTSALKALKVDGGKGCIAPSPETAQDGSYSPLARPLFLYVKKSSAANPEVKEFVNFYLKEGQALVEEVHYLPLPAASYAKVAEKFNAGKTGTVFGGRAAVGASIEEILKRESVQ